VVVIDLASLRDWILLVAAIFTVLASLKRYLVDPVRTVASEFGHMRKDVDEMKSDVAAIKTDAVKKVDFESHVGEFRKHVDEEHRQWDESRKP